METTNKPTTASGTFATNEDAEEKKRQDVVRIANEKELPLTEAEANMDLSKMHTLDLGDNQNYKTKICQKRWEV